MRQPFHLWYPKRCRWKHKTKKPIFDVDGKAKKPDVDIDVDSKVKKPDIDFAID